MARSIGMISFYFWSFITPRASSSESDFLLSTKFLAWRVSLGNGFPRVYLFRIEHGKMGVFEEFVESTKQNLASTIAYFIQLVEPVRHDLGNRMTGFRQVVESTRQGLENKMPVFNHTELVLSVGQGLSFILAGILLNLISNRIWDVEQKNVSGLTILVHYIPMSFVHYLPLSITTLIVWCVGNKFFVKFQDIEQLPIAAPPLDPQTTGPSSSQSTGPAEPQATAPRDLGILDDDLRGFFYYLQKYGLPPPAMSPTSTIDGIYYTKASPGIIALTVHIREDVTGVESAFRPVETLPSGSKVLYRRFEIGPQTGNDELEDLRKLVLESMSRARLLDPDCTLQFGSFAVLKYTDSGLTWWRLQGHWTPTISDIRQSPRKLLDLLSGSCRKWIVKGWNLETATLKASTVDEIENVKVLHRYKMESGEDVLLCEEPHLVPNSAPMFRKKLYICASNSVEVQEKVVFDLQSEPMDFRRSYWNFVMEDLMPSRWTMTMILSLSLLGGWSRATHGTGLLPKLAWGRFDLPNAHDINIVGINLVLSHTWNEIYKFFLIYMFVMFIPILVWMLRQLQYDQILQSGSDLLGLRRTPTLEETTSTPSPTVQAVVEDNLSEYTLRRSSPATISFEDKKLKDTTSSSTPMSPAPVKSSMKTFIHSQEEDDDVPDPAGYARDGQYLSSTAHSSDKYPTVPMQGFVGPARGPEHESNRRVLNFTDHLNIKPKNSERNKIDEGNLQEYEDGVDKTDLPGHLNQGLEAGGFLKESSSRLSSAYKKVRHLRVDVPKQQTQISDFLTASGTFQDGDILLNRKGLRVATQEPTPTVHAAPQDGQMLLEDLETVKVIGKGSSGVVQLVRHKWTNGIFALKVIQMNIQETVRKQIVRELRINQAAQCPHVVVYYDAFYNNGVISIVLEYMDGGSLADVVKRVGKIPEPYLAGISKQVLQGLIFLHNRGIIHRDIKPSNLLVNHHGEVKISDFGVSANLANSMPQRDIFVGTCTYMSPERISGSNYGLDSDIWSLGLTLLECALGRFPYQPPGDEDGWSNFYELLETIVDQPPPVPPPSQFSPEFCSFIGSCMQKKPRDRMSAADLLKHPFLKKYADECINLAVLVPELSPSG